MRQARYVVQKAEGVGGNPIPEDEPCIVIRAQDKLALDMIEHYLDRYGCDANPYDERIETDLRQHREAIVAWQTNHPPKWADR